MISQRESKLFADSIEEKDHDESRFLFDFVEWQQKMEREKLDIN